MRILILAPQAFYIDRGTPIAVDLLLRALSAEGHEVEVLTYHLGSTPSYPNVTIRRIPRLPFVRTVPPGLSGRKLLCDLLLFAAMLGRLCRRRYDVVHAVEESVFMAMAARLLFRVPYVYDMDSSMPEQVLGKLPALRPLAPLLRLLERQAVRGSEAVAPVCEALARAAEAHGPKRVVLLRDVSLLAEGTAGCERAEDVRTPAELGLSGATGPVVMYVGNLEGYQGIDLLLEAFALAVREVPTLTLVVVGGTPADVARYERLAGSLSLGDRVRFLGPKPVAWLRHYLHAADILVSPRVRGENTPMKIYSYLHAGRAVLATDLPTHTQVLRPDVAMLAAPRPAPFAEALVRLAVDPVLRARLGEAGRRLVEERHTYRALAAQVAALYAPAEAAAVALAVTRAGAGADARSGADAMPGPGVPDPAPGKPPARPPGPGAAGAGTPSWPERLFSRSVLKQQKLREICHLLGDTRGLDCLDLGSDNGVVSLLLRRRGGRWHSADLDPTAVASIRELVTTNVHQLTGPRTPFPDDAFDVVVVVDLLEHVHDDAALVADLYRITRPGGRLVVNVPHAKDSWLRRLRLRLGQTDERHGHVRHGYTAESLARVLGGRYRIVRQHTYSRAFCETVDTLVTAAYGLLEGPRRGPSSKGALVTGADLARFRTLFRVYSGLYPFLRVAAGLDRLLWFTSGYMLIAEARSTKAASAAARAAAAPRTTGPG